MRKKKSIITGLYTFSFLAIALFISNKTMGQSISAASYKPKVDFVTGTNPSSVAIADVDGDGKSDMIITNSGSNTISVFRNTSVTGSINTFSFAAKVDFVTGNNPTIVAIADLDGDGKPDLAVPNRSSGTISILRNTSTPGTINASSFASKVDFATGTGALCVAIGDIDGDGKKDLAVANYNSGTVAVLQNTSTVGSINASSFASKVDFAVGYSSSIVAMADVDGDGKLDLAVSIFESNILSVLHNASTPGSISASSFEAKVDFITNANPYYVVINDLDGDGKPDLAITNASSANVSVFYNTSVSGTISTSSFASKVDFATGAHPVTVAVGDLNRDSKPELAIANQLSDNISVLRNTSGSGSITANSFAVKTDLATDNQPVFVAIGDLDGDGVPEIATTNLGSNTVSVFQTKTPPTTQWAKHPDGIIAGYTNPAISTDPEGNTYVTGGFIGTLTFPTLPSPTTLTSAGEADVFIAKYSASGNVLWAKRAGGTHGEVSNAIKYDGFGNIYIAGNYSTSTDFDGTILSNPATAANNVFLAKYNASTGNLLWVRQGISSSDYSDQTALGLAVDKNGDAYITGYFGIIKFDPLPTLNTVGWWDLYIVKYSSDGTPQWQTTAGSAEAGYYSEVGNSIAVDNTGNVFVTGSINGSSTYPTYFGNISLVSSGGGGFYESNFFLAKYNQSTSSWEWAVEGGGTTNDYGKNVSLDNQGNAYISGYFEGTGTFGSTTLTSIGGRDFFLAKYSANGNQVWMHSVEGVGYYSNNTSKVDANGNFYFAGNFDGTITVGDQILTSTGFDNTYVSAWNSNGDFQWVKHIPGNYYTQVNGLDVESNGNINIASVFAGTETFDCSVFSSLSYTDLIIAKLGYTNGSVAPTIQASANNICSGSNTTLSIADGNLNNATDWKWYTGSCGGTLIGSGSSITVTPAQNTTYYARSEGGCSGPSNCGSIAITVNNTTPSIGSVSAPLAPIPVNTSINLSVSTTANNIASAKIKWGDSTVAQIVNNPATNFSVAHTYTSPGVYTVITTITDGCGNTSAPYQYQYIVVYDPSAGFVTGGGWINSPAGAYRADTSLSGKAIFGFEARYQKGATIPTGNTEFKFQVGNLNFKSSNYEWLVVAGSKAQFKGTGTINGGGNYGFLLSAIDGDLGNTVSPDLFRIKIWDINNNGTIVYDNQYGTSDDGVLTTQIAQGSIVIHSNKTASSAMTLRENNANEIAAERRLQFTAIPNPSSNYFRLMLTGLNNEPITVKVIDALGRVIEMRNNVSANKNLTIGENYKPGTYLIEVIQGNVHQTKTVIKQ